MSVPFVAGTKLLPSGGFPHLTPKQACNSKYTDKISSTVIGCYNGVARALVISVRESLRCGGFLAL